MFAHLIRFIRDQYRTKSFIPLHAPVFSGQERNYMLETIDSTFVSCVGAFFDRFENEMDACTGTIGQLCTLIFNGNKIITTDGGGTIHANEKIGKRAKHLITTSKKAHPYKFVHEEICCNYFLPNLNPAPGCAQLKQLEGFIAAKRPLAARYAEELKGSEMQFLHEPHDCHSNNSLNVVICQSGEQRDALIKTTNDQGVMTRPIWNLMHHMSIYALCRKSDLSNAEWVGVWVVNLPSSAPQELLQ